MLSYIAGWIYTLANIRKDDDDRNIAVGGIRETHVMHDTRGSPPFDLEPFVDLQLDECGEAAIRKTGAVSAYQMGRHAESD